MSIGDVSPNRQQPPDGDQRGQGIRAERSDRPNPTTPEHHSGRRRSDEDPSPLADLVVEVLLSMPEWLRWARRSLS